PEVAQDVRIDCNSNEIWVAVKTQSGAFNGMIYPKGLSKNSSCMSEFVHQRSPVRYRLPLRSCNTMSTDLSDGGIEYFNTIVVQPHLKLVTNQGRGFHIRCRYTTKDKTITNDVNVSMMDASPLTATAPMPGCTMKIFYGDPSLHEVAENVKIGDPLTLVISIDQQDAFGLRISDCLVRDGLGWGEQRLIDEDGCPIDGEIMGQFKYSPSKTTASVHFQAHKFPYTASVYYQCNVRLCIKADHGCDDVPPTCENNAVRRRRRDTEGDKDGGTPATIEVYSGLYVNEATDIKGDVSDDVAREKTPDDPNSICISQRNFAIGIAIAGLVLMLAVIAAILILLARRRHRKEASTTGSSIYSGPYTNTAYSHSS
ncbi:Cuticlin-1, partial [Zootermopsis nevadensis]